MADEKQPSSLGLGIYTAERSTPRITAVEVIAMLLSVVWLAGMLWFYLGAGVEAPSQEGGSTLSMVIIMLAVLLPIALIWVAASAAKTARILREESARLQSSIDAMRAAYVAQQQSSSMDVRPAVVAKLDEIAEAQRSTETALATFTSTRNLGQASETRAAVVHPDTNIDQPQPSLALAGADQPHHDPISVADFVKALNFPDNEHDKEGFRTLRRALQDPNTSRLIRSSQDVLTLLSQDGIYMDDLRPDRAKPELWRKFAKGDRGKSVAGLGGIHDRSSLALSAGRMKQDLVFRDAVHHFLRQFDRTLVDFEQNATDEEIVQMSETRTARAFMLLGRVTGTFD